MSKRNFINITELKGYNAECLCGEKMEIYNYGKLYWGQCLICKTKTKTYHSAFAVANEQHKKLLNILHCR